MKEILPGYVLSQYTFEEKLGEGGMGEVWRARHVQLDHEVAIKFLNQQFAQNRDLQERFLNEGRRQALLEHPHIVRALDFLSDGGRHFLVLQFVEGGGLDQLIEQGPLPVDEALEISYQVLAALGYAHRKGVIHRDVKPSNILLDANRECYLTDFGIALAAGQKRVTRTGTVMGTAYYMSPEQIHHPNLVDNRTDIYAFGIVLYEMLTGTVPFDAEGGNEFLIKQAHIEQTPRKPSLLNPAIPRKVEAVVMRSLAKEPGERFKSCEEMSDALRLAIGQPPIRRTQPQSKPVTVPLSGGGEPGWWQRNKVRVFKTAAVLFCTVGLAAFASRLFKSQPAPPGPPIITSPQPKSPVNEPVQTKPQEYAKPLEPERAPERAAPVDVSPPVQPPQRVPEQKPSPMPPVESRPEPPQKKSEPVKLPEPVRVPTPKPEPVQTVSQPAPPQQQQTPPVKPPEVEVGDPGAFSAEAQRADRRLGQLPRPQILRPEINPAPNPAPPVRVGPASGTMFWTIELRRGQVYTLGNDAVEGDRLPGVEVDCDLDARGLVVVVEGPSPSNGWRTVKVRALVNRPRPQRFQISWKRRQ